MDGRASLPANNLARLASSILRLRQFRSACLPAELFGGEQAWDMLLVLFLADTKGERLSGAETVERSGGPANAGRRWMQALTQLGLIVGDGEGRLEDPLTLTPQGIDALEHWLSEADVFFARQQA